MGCCLTIILAFIALCVLFIWFAVGLVMLDIVFFLLFWGSKANIEKLKKTNPSKMVCQNCKSKNVKLATRKSGETISGNRYRGWVSGDRKIHYERIAECKSCGFTWNYITQEDIDNQVKQEIGIKNFCLLVFLVLLAVTMWVFL